ncbi:MAG: SEL1-like repeat protein [Gammaproteobacteria bacterium]|nr:SEL1-like repeat protein [Gammaproteobacteria bacterium]
MAFAATLCVCTASFAENENDETRAAEVRFNIQLTGALNNDPEAQYLVAEMYEQGLGTPQNLRMAHLWYTKSAKQGYAPATEKLDKWEKVRQESEKLVQQRAAEERKRRQAEAEAEAATAKAAREEAAAKEARERAVEEQKRRVAEAEAAAAKAAREETAARAARDRAAEEQKRRVAEGEAAAAKATRESASKPARANSELPPVVKDSRSAGPEDTPKETAAISAEKGSEEFRANPCLTPTAKFTSVCQ